MIKGFLQLFGKAVINMKRKLEYMGMGMKHYSEIKKKLSEAGLDIDRQQLQPFMDIFFTVMDEAYEKGYKDGRLKKGE
jgi:competence protein ComZ